MTLLAPVPPWMLLICQVVGGKKALPWSHSTWRPARQCQGRQVDRVLPGAGRRCGPGSPLTVSLPDMVPRRPFLIMSPVRLTDVGSPTMQ